MVQAGNRIVLSISIRNNEIRFVVVVKGHRIFP